MEQDWRLFFLLFSLLSPGILISAQNDCVNIAGSPLVALEQLSLCTRLFVQSIYSENCRKRAAMSHHVKARPIPMGCLFGWWLPLQQSVPPQTFVLSFLFGAGHLCGSTQ